MTVFIVKRVASFRMFWFSSVQLCCFGSYRSHLPCFQPQQAGVFSNEAQFQWVSLVSRLLSEEVLLIHKTPVLTHGKHCLQFNQYWKLTDMGEKSTLSKGLSGYIVLYNYRVYISVFSTFISTNMTLRLKGCCFLWLIGNYTNFFPPNLTL